MTAMASGEITIRVRYAETDRMGLLHHANYLVYFEMGFAFRAGAEPNPTGRL